MIADLVASVVPRDGSGSQLLTALEQPQRVMDTRIALGAGAGRKNGEVVLTLPAGVVPAGATGAVLNVTTTGANRTGFVSVYGTRQVALFVGGSGTPLTHVVVDVVGYLTSTG